MILPVMSLSSVVFPAPLRPMMPSREPELSLKLTFRSAQKLSIFGFHQGETRPSEVMSRKLSIRLL